jgi:hypothetical protein
MDTKFEATGNVSVNRKSILELLASYILASTGIIYATGFLVVLAFLDRFGIREAGADFWKARYIHIGILCLSFPLILNGTVLSLMYLIFNGKYNKSLMWQRLLPVGILVINLEITCFILIMLTDRHIPGGGIIGLIPLQWIIGVTFLGIPAALTIERIIEKIMGKIPASDADLPSASQTLTVSLRWILAVIIAGLDVWFVLDFRGTIAGGFPILAITYVAFSIILGVIVSTVSVYENRQEHERRKKAIFVLAIAVIGPFFYLVILSFSYGVYQNIPATRGGGDFTNSPKVIITFKDPQKLSSSDMRYFDKTISNVTIPLLVIEETSWAFYLADPNEAGGPTEWKQIGGRKPQILIINKREVSKLHSESRNSSGPTP